MPTKLPSRLRLPLAALAAFAVTFAVLIARGDEEPAAPDPTAAASVAPARDTAGKIAQLQAALRERPTAGGYAALAAAELQRARETGDAGHYLRADAAVKRALARDPDEPGALTEAGALAASRHDFRAALTYARRARAAAPEAVRPYGVLVDALVELGRYGEAERALQQMVDRKPGSSSYARVSYLRELHGDVAGALEAMTLAVSAGGEAPENAAALQTLLADLELLRGRTAVARRGYEAALARFPGYAAAEAGLARVDVARGRLAAAIRRYRAIVARLPLPEYAIALGEAEQAAGRSAAARETFALVGAERTLLDRAGVSTDTELAVFEADHGSPREAVRLARRGHAAAPSVRSADALGWALTRAGDARAGLGWARRALRLGSVDPSFLAHAGIAARRAGRSDEAGRLLRRALRGRARLSPLLAARAARTLEALR